MEPDEHESSERNQMQDIFHQVKEIDWSNATVSLYVVNRNLIQRVANYKVLQVNADESLRRKLRDISKKQVDLSNEVIGYDFNTADLDNDVLAIQTSETDFEQLIKIITSDDSDSESVDQVPKFVRRYEELIGSWIYVARLDVPDQPPLYAARRVSSSWTSKKVNGGLSMIFKDTMMIDLDQEEIFRVEPNIDFYVFNGFVFIANKNNFEIALNFREGMEENRDKIVEDFKEQAIFQNAEDIAHLVGDNVKRLRRLSKVKKSAYYHDPQFLANLQMVNDEESWGIKYSDDGKLIASEETIDTILLVLNNDRLTSKINAENFDVDVKHRLGNSV
jgi:hypothetical protein